MEKESKEILVSVKKLAEVWGITVRAVYAHAEKGNIPRPENGRWKWPEINWIMLEHYRKQAAGRGGNEGLISQKERILRAKAEQVELEIKKQRGELVDIAEVGKGWGRMVHAFKNRILAIPRATAQEIAQLVKSARNGGPEDERELIVAVEKILTPQMHGALEELSEGKE